jgi:hypothetical protein
MNAERLRQIEELCRGDEERTLQIDGQTRISHEAFHTAIPIRHIW